MLPVQIAAHTALDTLSVKEYRCAPHRFAVVLLNDDYTTMDFVVSLLMNVFMLSHTRAMAIMMLVHQQGRGVCGVFQKDIAETRCQQVIHCAAEAGYPLRCVVEPV